MALFVDLVALSNGLHGSVQMDSVALFSWIGWLRHHGIFKKRINNALMENRNAIIKLVTKAANGYRNWERFRNRCMLVLEKGIDFEIDKDDGSVKMVEKMDPDN